jgi:small conductance mechanosensitive channel
MRVMRFVCFILACLALFPATTLAQTTAAPAANPPAAGVEELVRILENEEARKALLARLKAEAPAKPAGSDEAASEPTLPRQLAEHTRAIAEELADAGQRAWRTVSQIGAVFDEPARLDYQAIREVAIGVALTGAALFLGFLVLRLLARPGLLALERRAQPGAWALRAVLAAAASAIDLAMVIMSWGLGYVVALQIVGGATGRMGINQTLLLNAFLAVEIGKVAMRAVLRPRYPGLRLFPCSDITAAYWYFWLARALSLIGYSFMFAAPILTAHVSIAAAQAVRVLALLTALVIGTLIMLQNRQRVRARLSARAASGRADLLGRAGIVLARIWHLLAIGYLLAIFVIWLVNPHEALPFVLGATLRSLLAVAIGGLVVAFISRFVSAGLALPDDVRLRLPALEGRLRAFVPRVLQVVRMVVLVGILIAVAQAWGLIDGLAWLGSETGQRAARALVSAGFILLLGFAAYLAVSSWIEYRLNPDFGTVPTAREKTLLSLFRNAFTVALVVMVAMLALGQIGVNIAPLLAGAGVLGLAIGFGAQKLVQDIITGVFIQLENIMNEGDVVTLGGVSGVVEKLTIRSVSIRDLGGTLHLIPFSSVDTVANMVKDFSYHLAEIGVAYRENIAEVKEAMQEAFDLLLKSDWGEKIIGPLEMHGITAFGDSAITVRARIKTLPAAHWGAGRAYNELVKEVFDRGGIEIPFPHLTLYMGEDKAGRAPALHVKGPARPGAGPAEALPSPA